MAPVARCTDVLLACDVARRQTSAKVIQLSFLYIDVPSRLKSPLKPDTSGGAVEEERGNGEDPGSDALQT